MQVELETCTDKSAFLYTLSVRTVQLYLRMYMYKYVLESCSGDNVNIIQHNQEIRLA